MKNWSNRKRLSYLSKIKIIKCFKKEAGSDLGVFLLSNYLVAKKLPYTAQGYILWKNEINSLKKVRGIPFFPQLVAIDYESLCIYMTYCGKNLLECESIPNDYKNQLTMIKKILKKKNLNPNDILPRNVCILDKTIKIIDFGLANISHNDLERSLSKLDKLFSIS